MTHDELLAKIDQELETDYADPCGNFPIGLKALRAVVELHKPKRIATPCPDGNPGCAVLHLSDKYSCSCGFWNYPCPTIQAIERELS
jgi:hypothetical protein